MSVLAVAGSTIAVVVAAIVVVLVIAIILLRRRARTDTVEAFRTHIDALSPEARRPVVDKVQELEQEERRGDESGGDMRGS